MRMGMDLDRIRQTVEKIVDEEGYELVDLEFRGSGPGRVVRIFIDKPDGISHRDCELISSRVGIILDVEDWVPFSYTLEVSSPGLDRKLVKESDYNRFQERLAKIQTKIPLNNQKVFKGRLKGLLEGKVRIELRRGEIIEIPLEVIREARLEFEWARGKF